MISNKNELVERIIEALDEVALYDNFVDEPAYVKRVIKEHIIQPCLDEFVIIQGQTLFDGKSHIMFDGIGARWLIDNILRKLVEDEFVGETILEHYEASEELTLYEIKCLDAQESLERCFDGLVCIERKFYEMMIMEHNHV